MAHDLQPFSQWRHLGPGPKIASARVCFNMSIKTEIKWLFARRTRIIATLGPASSNSATIRELIAAGTNLFRLNMSHGDHAGHKGNIRRIRALAAEMNRPVAILADLCGPKIRVGRFLHGGITLTQGQRVTVTTRDVPGEDGLIPSQYRELASDVACGHHILLADGMMELQVEAVEGTEIGCRIVHGGTLTDHKGMNLPDSNVSTASLTEKDRRDAAFALGSGVDFLALSFVRSAADVHELRELIAQAGSGAGLVAKIERAEALEHATEILEASDGIMVARGDLGVELPPEQVPMVQQALISRARLANKPVIIATQMLESMIEQSRPTRAEVADVSHAVASGADAVMLSGETAVGADPVAVVKMMDRVARHTESNLWYNGTFGSFDMEKVSRDGLSVTDALAISTAQLSRDLQISCIMVISETGASAAAVSSARPAAPVVVITPVELTFRKMSLFWGVLPVLVEAKDLKNIVRQTRLWSRQLGLAKSGDRILLVRWFHPDPKKSTPSVTVLNV